MRASAGGRLRRNGPSSELKNPDLLESACGYFGLGLKEAHLIIREVAKVTSGWRAIAVEVGAKASEISRMASAFEHEDLNRALKL